MAEEKKEVKNVEKKAAAPAAESAAEASSKNRTIALLLCFFLGWAGGHRIYAGKVGTGLLMFFTMGGFGLWYFADFVMISIGRFTDKDNRPVINWA